MSFFPRKKCPMCKQRECVCDRIHEGLVRVWSEETAKLPTADQIARGMARATNPIPSLRDRTKPPPVPPPSTRVPFPPRAPSVPPQPNVAWGAPAQTTPVDVDANRAIGYSARTHSVPPPPARPNIPAPVQPRSAPWESTPAQALRCLADALERRGVEWLVLARVPGGTDLFAAVLGVWERFVGPGRPTQVTTRSPRTPATAVPFGGPGRRVDDTPPFADEPTEPSAATGRLKREPTIEVKR